VSSTEKSFALNRRGKNSLRVRAVKQPDFIDQDWALDTLPKDSADCRISIEEDKAIIKNGKISALVRSNGLITFRSQKGEIILQEYVRNRDNLKEYCSPLAIPSREWKFDPEYWPDPEGMIRELKNMGIELMVSVWPTVAKDSENYQEMLKKDYLVKNDMGITTHVVLMLFSTHDKPPIT